MAASSSSNSTSFNRDNDSNKTSKKTENYVVVLNANARSLGPKIDSLADCMHKIDADIAIITKTWLQDLSINDTTVDLAGEHGLELFTLNKSNIAANGRQYRGVAIVCRGAKTTMKRLEVNNPENY